ncbi:hypothetical protein [Aurantimicrobium minutum]|uniref:hypothetical protein n=1 Tax=Aurantimicrobium minutum TaxID=708131 RepID=UPI002477095A|nr:hypothetical protein [Aurantimicrobium minutum]MDH6536931.1 hypothetical protein [Aurantimicrobium minutum]
MTHIMPKYRVAITATSEQDLFALQYAFAGQMAHREHQQCKDDVLVAALLGWHFRSIGGGPSTYIKSVIQEFYFRSSPDLEWMDPDELRLRKNSRGIPSTPGNILTIDGIDNKTLSRIEARAHSVKRMLTRLEEIETGRGEDSRYQSLNRTLAGYSDQAIMDLNIWFVLNMTAQPDDVVEGYPTWIKDEIQARGQARAEYEAGTLVEDEGDESQGANELPPLSPRERRAFLLRRRIHPGEKFWTDERIRAAMLMGL